MDGRKIEIHLEQIPWSWKFDGKKMWSEDGAKRSRKDYFLVVKKLTIPVGFDRKCSGKCGAFGLQVVVTIQTGGHVCFLLSKFQQENQTKPSWGWKQFLFLWDCGGE